MNADRLVVKVGGSLFDWAPLPRQLRLWTRQQPEDQILLAPGGGPAAEVIRGYDRVYSLGEEKAHWLALRSLTLNAHFLAEILKAPVVARWQQEKLAILDAQAFCQEDEGQPGCLPHGWEVTSDSVAARAARVFNAGRFVVLKSTSWPEALPWQEAGRQGIVDDYFSRAAVGLKVELVNFRIWPGPEMENAPKHLDLVRE